MIVVADITKRPEASTYITGETIIQNCSARSLYPMTVTWQESRSLFAIKNKIDSRKTEGLYNVLNSTISVRISLLTPLSFNMWCKFYTYIYFQPDNFTKVHGLYQKGLLFDKPKASRAFVDTAYQTMTIYCKSISIVLPILIQYRAIIHHL